MLVASAHATVFLISRDNVSFAYEDADAAFGGVIPPTGLEGVLRRSIPYDGCEPFTNVVEPGSSEMYFALISRGNCQFDVKVLNAQLAGYSAAIIYNNVESNELITMSGRNMWEVGIPAVFVTLNSGRQMMALMEQLDTVCFLLPTFDSAAWSIMTASFISLLAVSAVLTAFMYIRRHRLQPMGLRMMEREPPGMPAADVKALPEITFQEGAEESRGMETCAICLEDYEADEKLRLLPCKHGFHTECVDQWLMTRRPFCPVCKRDAKENGEDGEASTSTSSRQSRGRASDSNTTDDESRNSLWWLRLLPPADLLLRPMLVAQWGGRGVQSLEAPLLPVAAPPETQEAAEDARRPVETVSVSTEPPLVDIDVQEAANQSTRGV